MKETFIVRTEWYDSISELTEQGQAVILRNLFRYHLDPDNEMELDSQEVRIVWKLIRKNLDLNIENYEKRRGINKANGSKGGRPKANETENNQMGYSGLSEKPNVTLSVLVTDTVLDTVTDTVTDTVIDTERKEEANFSNENSEPIFFDENGIEIKPNNQPTETRVAPGRKLKTVSEVSERFLNKFITTFDTKPIVWTDSARNKARWSFDKSIERLGKMEDNKGLNEVTLHNLLWNIIKFLKEDKFWAVNFKSPTKLMETQAKTGFVYLDIWANDYRMKSPELAKQRRDAETDRLIRNDEAQRERKKHEESQF